jgi:hypothetical protein
MSIRAGAALFVLTAALFLIANRAAYQGYFQDDELDNISWTRYISPAEFAQATLTPRLFTNNFRPVGHFYFREMSLLFGLDFPFYLPLLHLAHLLNVFLVWRIARALGIAPLAASLGTLLFGFHMAAFDVYWKPMYAFDLFCATFCLLAILLYMRRRYVLSFCAFWLAYKSKELAVMLPVVLACYEFWLMKDRKWKRLLPFFAVSLSFGLQAVLLNSNAGTEYAFHFTPAAFWRCLTFYASQLFLLPYAGLALIAAPLLIRDRRLWLGAAILILFFGPLLFLPGRLFAAYCYLPIAGLALMAAAIASKPRLMPAMAIFCVAWIPWNLAQLRRNRRVTLAQEDAIYTYVSTLEDYAAHSKRPPQFAYDGAPDGFHEWGIQGALQFLYGVPAPTVRPFRDPEARASLKRDGGMLLEWDPIARKLAVVAFKVP